MKIKNLMREIETKIEGKFIEKHYPNSNLIIVDNIVELAGPKWAFVAKGVILSTDTTYTGSDFHMSMQVMVKFQTSARLERWFVRF